MTAVDLDRRLTGIRPADASFDAEVIVLSADEEAALLALGYVTGSPGEGAGTRRNPADAVALAHIHQQALEAKAKGDLETAAKLFARELEEDPASPVLLWYLGSCEVESAPARAAERFRNAMELRPDFEAPFISLAELMLQNSDHVAAYAVASAGINQTIDADGRLHYLRAAAIAQTGVNVDDALRDLGVAVERAARPGPAYRLRAAIRLRSLDDVDGALSDLESYAEWSDGDELGNLQRDRSFEKLQGDPRFESIVTRYAE